MRNLSLLIIVLLPLFVHAQLDYRARINGYDFRLAQAPNGQLALAGNEVYVTPNPGKDWTKATDESDEKEKWFLSRIEHICWASNDTLIAGDSDGVTIYVRKNGNQFEQSGPKIGQYVDALRSNGRGKVWYCDIDQSINYSDDCGKTWTKTPLFTDLKPHNDQRVADFYFTQDDKTGILGTNWNALYVTTDNCKTLKRIATPLDQKCYTLRYKQQQPRFNTVRIIGDYYVVSQNYKVFVTSSRQIEWKPLKDVFQFEVTDDDHLIVNTEDDTIRRLDRNLQTVDEYPITDQIAHFQCLGSNLYAYRNGTLYEVSHDGTKSYGLFRADKRIDIPSFEDYPYHDPIDINGHLFYADDHDIYAQDDNGAWYRYLSLGGKYVFNAFVAGDTLCFYDGTSGDKGLYCIDLNNKAVTPYPWPERLFADKKVTELQFYLNNSGCHHQVEHDAIFKSVGDSFVWQRDSISGTTVQMSPSKIPHRSIRATDVQQLARMIDLSRNQSFALSDTVITDEDRNEFKQLLGDLKKTEEFRSMNIDYDKYTFAGEDIQSLNDKQLRDIIRKDRGVSSTTVITYGVKLTFDDGTEVTCSNSDYLRNYTLAPWSVKFGNLEYQTDCLLIGLMIDKLADGKFIPAPYCNKAYAIFQMVHDKFE